MSVFDDLFTKVQNIPYIDVFNIDPATLVDPAILAQIKIRVIENHLSSSEVIEVLEQLLKYDKVNELKDSDKIWYQNYINLVDYLRFRALPFLNDQDIVDLFKTRIIFAIQQGIDLTNTIEVYLINVGDDLVGGRQRKLILDALRENEERLGDKSIVLGSTRDLQSYIKNWLIDYDASGENNETPSAFKESSYVTNGKHANELKPTEKEILLSLLKFYDYLRFGKAEFPSLAVLRSSDNKIPVSLDDDEDKISDFTTTLRTAPVVGNDKIINKVPSNQVAKNKVSSSNDLVVEPSVIPELKSPIPTFSFDQENEKDVKRRELLVSHWQEAKTIEQEVRVLAEEIIKQHNFSFKDEVNKKRFVNLFVSRVKDVRSIVEVRETLLKSQEAGGLGMTSEKIDAVVKIIEGAKKDFEHKVATVGLQPVTKDLSIISQQIQKIKEPESQEITKKILKQVQDDKVGKLPMVKPVTELDKLIAAEAASSVSLKQLEVKESEGNVVTGLESQKVKESESQGVRKAEPVKVVQKGIDEDKLKSWREEMLKEIAKVAPPVPLPERKAVEDLEKDIDGGDFSNNVKVAPKNNINIPITTPSNTANKKEFMGIASQPSAPHFENSNIKPTLADIKAPPRVVGPIEELKALTLIDLRRMGDTLVALDKIKGMVDLIGEHSVAKRLEAVKAWQTSPLYQQYVKLGHDSIVQGRGMADLAGSVEGGLTEKEFNAIADFNVRLRF